MLANLLAVFFFLLNPPPPPPPGEPAPNGELTAEEAAQYEAEYNACAGAWDPDGCRADLYQRYYGS